MRVYPEKLAAELDKQLLPVYLVSGDEPLLQQECCDLIRAKARAEGCGERQVIDAAPKNFDWQEILHDVNSMSLFAERRLVEIRLPSGKPGADGSKALCEYVERMGPDDILLIVAGKIDKKSTNSKWHKALDKAGATIAVWEVKPKDLPRWLQGRVRAAGLEIDRDALQMMCERLEGNLLAAVQEVEKLKLLAEDGRISIDTVTRSVSDNARYNVFGLADIVLKGDARSSLRMLQGLRGEGSEPPMVLWVLSRELRALYGMRLAVDGGTGINKALDEARVWQSRAPLVQAALERHSGDSLAALLQQAVATDASIKGYGGGKPWDHLETLALGLAASSATLPPTVDMRGAH